MPTHVPIADAPKMEDVDLESADTRSEILPEAYAVKTGTEPDEPIQAQPVHGGPQPGDRIIIRDEAGEFPIGWCLLPWFSCLCCCVPVVSTHESYVCVNTAYVCVSTWLCIEITSRMHHVSSQAFHGVHNLSAHRPTS
eukprot:2931-Heterococcus_DN1.PRE.9